MTFVGATGARSTTASRRRALGPHVARRRRLFWPFALPALGLYVAILVGPTVATVVLSASRWSGSDTPHFNGWAEYRELFASPAFRSALVNTLVYVLAGGVGTFLVAFLFTMVLRDMRGNKLIRTILFFPNIVAPVALSMFLGLALKDTPGQQGLANSALAALHIPAVSFLAPEHLTWVVMAALVWASAGFYITILMAGVDRIPPYLYEDADIAGSSTWQKFRHVTLPLTWDVVGVAGVLWTIGAIKIFELVYLLAGPGTFSPPSKTWTLGIFVYDRSFGAAGTPQYGEAAACAVVMMALVVVLVLLMRRMMRRDAIQF